MRLTTQAEIVILAKEKKEASGNYGESYKLAIMQGSEAGSMSCTKDAFEAIPDDGLMKPYIAHFTTSEYNGNLTQRITGVTPLRR